MSKHTPIPLDAGDVTVERIERAPCDACDMDAVATHVVRIDFRNLGQSGDVIGVYCRACANKTAKRLKASLPKEAT